MELIDLLVVNLSAVPAVATFKFATRVLLVTTSGAVPVASVLVICPPLDSESTTTAPAVKPPEPSRATIALLVFALVAVVALLLTLLDVLIVLNFESAILPANMLLVTEPVSPVVTTVPLTAGKVIVVVPADTGTSKVTVPLVLPVKTSFLPEAKTKFSLLFQALLLLSQLKVLSTSAPAFRVIPPPFAVVLLGVATLPNSIFLSSTVNVVLLIVVVVPLTVKSPVTVKLPPTVAAFVTLREPKVTLLAVPTA